MFSYRSIIAIFLTPIFLLPLALHFSMHSFANSPFRLPVISGATVTVTQGNSQGDHIAANGSEYAFDFIVGQENFVITAAQGGTVVGVNDSSTIQCGGLNQEIAPQTILLKHCWAYANFVLIADDDGKTASLYMHLLPYSSQTHMPKVSVGEHVNQGDPIGLAGTTGWSTGVHLHFQVESLPSSSVQQSGSTTGWWWTNSLPISFSNPEILMKRQNGIPETGDVFMVSTSFPSPSQTVTTPEPKLDFTPFVGTWYAHAQTMVIYTNGTAIYTGRVFTWCTDDPRPPCDTNNGAIIGGLNARITFTNISGTTASGTITGGTGDRDIHNNIWPVGSALSVTLNTDDTLQVSDGSLLCGPIAIQHNANEGCNSGA